MQALAALLAGEGAIEAYVLPRAQGEALMDAREKSFWLGKRAGLHDLVDVVVPRASICDYMTAVSRIALARSAFIGGCGHAGDGNIHLAIYKEDPDERDAVIRDLLAAGLSLGGAISGEHGIGTLKKPYFQDLENIHKIELLRRIKMAFDPSGILNPGVIFDLPANGTRDGNAIG